MFLSHRGFSQWEIVIHSEPTYWMKGPWSFHPVGVFFIYFSNQRSPTKQTKEGTTGCLPKGKGAGGREGRWEWASVWWRQKGKGWRREADKERRTNERGRKDKRREAAYSVLLCWEHSRTQREAGSLCQKIIAFRHRLWKLWAMQNSRLGFFII